MSDSTVSLFFVLNSETPFRHKIFFPNSSFVFTYIISNIHPKSVRRATEIWFLYDFNCGKYPQYPRRSCLNHNLGVKTQRQFDSRVYSVNWMISRTGVYPLTKVTVCWCWGGGWLYVATKHRQTNPTICLSVCLFHPFSRCVCILVSTYFSW